MKISCESDLDFFSNSQSTFFNSFYSLCMHCLVNSINSIKYGRICNS